MSTIAVGDQVIRRGVTSPGTAMVGIVVRTGIEGRTNGGVDMVRVSWSSGSSSLVTVSDLTKVER